MLCSMPCPAVPHLPRVLGGSSPTCLLRGRAACRHVCPRASWEDQPTGAHLWAKDSCLGELGHAGWRPHWCASPSQGRVGPGGKRGSDAGRAAAWGLRWVFLEFCVDTWPPCRADMTLSSLEDGTHFVSQLFGQLHPDVNCLRKHMEGGACPCSLSPHF